MFKLEPESCEKGANILDQSSMSNTLYFVEDGVVEVYTRFEGSQFVLEQLHKGSAINHRAIFMEGQMSVSMKCHTDAKLLKLSQESLAELIQKYQNDTFGKNLMIYQNKLLKKEQKFPCDYVMRLPRHYQVDDGQIRRNNAFKNVVMRIVLEIREKAKRPKLADFISIYKDQKSNAEPGEEAMIKKEF